MTTHHTSRPYIKIKMENPPMIIICTCKRDTQKAHIARFTTTSTAENVDSLSGILHLHHQEGVRRWILCFAVLLPTNFLFISTYFSLLVCALRIFATPPYAINCLKYIWFGVRVFFPTSSSSLIFYAEIGSWFVIRVRLFSRK